MTGRQYGIIGFAGVGFLVVTLVALHFLDPDLSVVDEYMSVYALGDYGWLLRIGEFAAGLGTIAIALGLRMMLASGKRVTASWVLMMIAGLGFLVGAVFVTDPTGAYEAGLATISGAVHDLAGLVQSLSLLIASWILRGVFVRDDGYEHFARTQLWFAVLLTVTFLIQLVAPAFGAVGVTQRVFIVVILTWLLVLAANIHGARKSTRESEPNPPVRT
jgi:hypothetical protein